VPQNPRELGRRAAQRLFKRLGGRNGAPALGIPADEILVRGSGDIVPIDNRRDHTR
jgi:hypothetical protein